MYSSLYSRLQFVGAAALPRVGGVMAYLVTTDCGAMGAYFKRVFHSIDLIFVMGLVTIRIVYAYRPNAVPTKMSIT